MFDLLDELVNSMLFYMEKPTASPEAAEYASPQEYKDLLLDNLVVVGKVKLNLRQMCECGGAPMAFIFMEASKAMRLESSNEVSR